MEMVHNMLFFLVKTINCGGATLVYGFHISIECAEGLHFSAFS